MQSDKGIPILLVGLLTLQTALLGVLAFKLNRFERLLLEVQAGISSVLTLASAGGGNLGEIVDIEPGNGPAKGRPDAPVTIIEFSDFNCQACADLQPTLRHILQQFQAEVRLVFRYFPVSLKGKPFLLARAAECGHRQGAFWALHDRLFARSEEIDSQESLLEEVAGLGLNLEAFTSCLDWEEVAARLRADFEAGRSYGVNSTPTLFINGRRMMSTDIEYLRRAITASLQQAVPAEASRLNKGPLESENDQPSVDSLH